MATKTTNYNLTKPAQTDYYNVDVFNTNMDVIDKELKSNKTLATGKANTSHTHIQSDITDFNKPIPLKVAEDATEVDLDNIKSPGIYTSATQTNYLNCPTTLITDSSGKPNYAFSLIVLGSRVYGLKDTISYYIQICIDSFGGQGQNQIWERTHYGNLGWTAWYSLYSTKQKPTLRDIVGSDIVSVKSGGTGLNTLTQGYALIGNGINPVTLRYIRSNIVKDSNDLVTSGAVYSAISNFNIKNRTHIVVASYDTTNPLKSNSDYICTSTNASSVLKTAISAVAKGGTVELLDGTYNLQYNEIEIELNKDITIVGAGHTTVIKQPVDEIAGEAKPIFKITGQNVKIKNMMICDSDVSSPVSVINQQAQGAIYDELFFIFNATESTVRSCCICGSGDCSFTRIQNCRIYKSFNDSSRVMFDFSSCTNFGGAIGANISSGYNDISVKFANESHKNNTAIYGHSNIDIKIGD